MLSSNHGIVFVLGGDNEFATSTSPPDGPHESITTSAGLYRAADGQALNVTILYDVSDISRLSPAHYGSKTRDRRRVYRLFHDSGDEGEPTERGKTMLVMSAEHPDPDTLVQLHYRSFSIIRDTPGWRRSRGAQLVEGAQNVLKMLTVHEFSGDDALQSEQFELYVNDSERAQIVSECFRFERRIFQLEKELV